MYAVTVYGEKSVHIYLETDFRIADFKSVYPLPKYAQHLPI